MRLSFIEGVCLVAMGVAMVELHDGQRLGRPGIHSGPTLAAAKPAAPSVVRSHEVVSLASPVEGSR